MAVLPGLGTVEASCQSRPLWLVYVQSLISLSFPYYTSLSYERQAGADTDADRLS